ncbi:hypothetical protein MBLNU13_g02917t2 [Cladosporium sp. NU13]
MSPPPPAPYVEDVDSDGSAVVPNTRRDAGHHRQPSKTLPHMHKQRRDAASDSGYSSHASNTVASSTLSQPTDGSQHLKQASLPVNQIPLGRRDSQRNPSSASQCNDPHCGDPTCASAQNSERGYTLPHRPSTQRSQTAQFPVQEPGSALPLKQGTHYQYPQHHAGQPVPGHYNPQAETRQRAPSASQSRPPSWAQAPYGYANHYQQGIPHGSYGAQGQGIPASPSAYNRLPHMAQYPDWPNGMPPQITSGSPRDPFGGYMPGQAIPIPSNSQAYPPTLQAPYSARAGNPALSQEIAIPPASSRQSTQPTISARRGSIMPGSFPREELTFGLPSESESESQSSESSESEDDRDRRVRHEQPRRREHSRHREHSRRRREIAYERTRHALEDKKAVDRRLMPPPPQRERERASRPVLKHTQTTPADSRRRSREVAQRASYSDPHMYSDTDRSTRPSRTYSTKGDTRRPIITQHEKPGRSRAASRAYEEEVVQRQYVVEDNQGRKFYYNTQDEAIAKADRLDHQQRESAIEAYQASKRGNIQPVTLTAENVKRAGSAQQQQPKRAASHVSGSSKKSTTSTRLSTSESTIRIERGDDVFNIPGDRTVEIITKDGDTMIIGPGSPTREKSYHGSSAGSRAGGRSHHGSERGGRRRDTITEEDGYESAL